MAALVDSTSDCADVSSTFVINIKSYQRLRSEVIIGVAIVVLVLVSSFGFLCYCLCRDTIMERKSKFRSSGIREHIQSRSIRKLGQSASDGKTDKGITNQAYTYNSSGDSRRVWSNKIADVQTCGEGWCANSVSPASHDPKKISASHNSSGDCTVVAHDLTVLGCVNRSTSHNMNTASADTPANRFSMDTERADTQAVKLSMDTRTVDCPDETISAKENSHPVFTVSQQTPVYDPSVVSHELSEAFVKDEGEGKEVSYGSDRPEMTPAPVLSPLSVLKIGYMMCSIAGEDLQSARAAAKPEEAFPKHHVVDTDVRGPVLDVIDSDADSLGGDCPNAEVLNSPSFSDCKDMVTEISASYANGSDIAVSNSLSFPEVKITRDEPEGESLAGHQTKEIMVHSACIQDTKSETKEAGENTQIKETATSGYVTHSDLSLPVHPVLGLQEGSTESDKKLVFQYDPDQETETASGSSVDLSGTFRFLEASSGTEAFQDDQREEDDNLDLREEADNPEMKEEEANPNRKEEDNCDQKEEEESPDQREEENNPDSRGEGDDQRPLENKEMVCQLLQPPRKAESDATLFSSSVSTLPTQEPATKPGVEEFQMKVFEKGEMDEELESGCSKVIPEQTAAMSSAAGYIPSAAVSCQITQHSSSEDSSQGSFEEDNDQHPEQGHELSSAAGYGPHLSVPVADSCQKSFEGDYSQRPYQGYGLSNAAGYASLSSLSPSFLESRSSPAPVGRILQSSAPLLTSQLSPQTRIADYLFHSSLPSNILQNSSQAPVLTNNIAETVNPTQQIFNEETNCTGLNYSNVPSVSMTESNSECGCGSGINQPQTVVDRTAIHGTSVKQSKDVTDVKEGEAEEKVDRERMDSGYCSSPPVLDTFNPRWQDNQEAVFDTSSISTLEEDSYEATVCGADGGQNEAELDVQGVDIQTNPIVLLHPGYVSV